LPQQQKNYGNYTPKGLDVKNNLNQGGKIMFSKSLKRKVAVLLTGVMVLGMTVTAFAGDNDGGQTGTGAFEGTVDREIAKVVLPTVPAGAYDFILDAERLVQETGKMRYGNDVSFPAKNADTGVYFLSAEKTYTNQSAAYTVSNNGAVDINLTVEVEAVTNDAEKDVTLVSENIAAVDCTTRDTAVDEDAKLFLGLKVGDEAVVPVTKAAKATKTVTLAGKPENYEVSWNKVDGVDAYRFVMKDGASDFVTKDFHIEGSANYVLTAGDVTAPNLSVTWSWVTKKEADEEAAANAKVTVTFNSNGGSAVESQEITKGGTVSEPTAPTKDEDDDYTYAFAGWYSDAELENAFNFSTAINEATTLYAKWTPTAKVITGTAAVQKVGTKYYLGLKGQDGASFSVAATSVKVNTQDVTSDSALSDGYIVIESSKLSAKGINIANGQTLTAEYTVDGKDYQASVTISL
jgi:uncharacterized repeat protein (TIGR02543 family)